jgi:hypothetical protein
MSLTFLLLPEYITVEVTMKKFLSLALVLVLASFASAETWFKGSLDQAIAKAKTENKLVLVDFYSSG